ncbi:MAG: acetyl-CoA C-acetyltransferase [Candidatus Izimaplasma sp.]|nr:acetyl-CoA C-acetyltransferase [Candidatus Izimaplasma bacterium]
MSKVYIVSAKRTPIGSFLGALGSVHPAELGVTVVKAILEENNIPKEDIDELIVGNILPAGIGQGLGRQVSIGAGIPISVPAYSLNMVCGSGMKSIMNAYTSIKAGFHNVVLAGGTESMSGAPFILPSKVRKGIKMGGINMKDHVIDDALTDVFNNVHMGITAENIAAKYNLSRLEQDEFAMSSQVKAIKAIDNGRFKEEIVPVIVKSRRGETIVDTDEYPNRTTNLEKLGKLRPAFKKDGSVTAGNSSGINDGASFMLLVSEEALKKYDLKPLVEIVSIGQGGVEPLYMGLGPVPAIKNVFSNIDLTLADMGLLELNEAFSAQSLGVIHDLVEQHNLTREEILERTNVNGGAIALGHPVGASGNRITTTLIHEMLKRKTKYGLASLCIGGGMGTAIIVKNMEVN